MAVKFTNNAKTTLASGINSSVTTATVTDGSVFPTLDAGEHFYCTFDDGTNNEIVKVTARSGNTLTIIRGVDSTTARSFSSGDAAELRATSALLTDIQENIAAKSANQTVYSATTASSATSYDIGIDPGVEANASVFLDGVYQHHDTFSFSGSTLTFDTAPVDGTALEVIVDNLVNLQSSNLTVDTFTAADVGGNPQVDFTLSDAPAAETNLIVFVDGVFQANDTYTISSTTLSMTDGVTADRVVTVYVMNPVNIGTPSDNTITSSKLSGDITMPGDLTVTGDVAFDSPTFVVDNANSRVGIGTASPSTLLDIVGDVKMSANLTVDTSTLVVDATNNRVGIGTSSPSRKLHVVESANNDVATFINNDATNGYGLNINAGGTASGRYALRVANQANSVVLQANADGNVGIGTASINANAKLHVSGGNVRIDTDANSTFTIGDGGADAITLYGGTGDELYIGANNAYKLRFKTDGNIVMDNGGSLGIGVSSPSHDLTIQKSGQDNYIRIGSNSDGYDAGVYFGTNADWSIGVDNSNSNAFSIASGSTVGTNPRVTINSSGNVGIGTDNPATELQIGDYSDNLEQITIATASDQTGRINFYNNNSTEGASIRVIGGGNGAKMYFANRYDSDSDKVTFDLVSGRVGVGAGTTSPDDTLHVDSPAGTARIRIGSGNAAYYTKKGYLGDEWVFGSGETGDVVTSTISGGNFSSLNTGGAFVWKTATSGGTPTEKMRIDSSGNLLVGTISNALTGAGFIARPNDFISYTNTTTDTGDRCLLLNKQNATGTIAEWRYSNSTVGSITITGSSTSYNTSSDYRLKENVDYDFNALDRVAQLKPARFNFIANADITVDGFLAHEVQDIVPEAISGEKDAVDSEGNPQYQGIDHSKLVPLLTKAIQEQQTQIEALKQEIREIREGG